MNSIRIDPGLAEFERVLFGLFAVDANEVRAF
jgi:hypothetical protein